METCMPVLLMKFGWWVHTIQYCCGKWCNDDELIYLLCFAVLWKHSPNWAGRTWNRSMVYWMVDGTGNSSGNLRITFTMLRYAGEEWYKKIVVVAKRDYDDGVVDDDEEEEEEEMEKNETITTQCRSFYTWHACPSSFTNLKSKLI